MNREIEPKPFRNRTEAGRILAAELSAYASRPDVLVLALPRGGVPVGYEVARALHAPFDVFIVRKMGLPGHEEFATTQGRALYSFNVTDYMPLHARFIEERKAHARIILAAQRQYSIGEQLRRLLSLVADMTAEIMRDQVVFLSSWV